MVSQLLYDLPASERYRIIFMNRDLDEMLASQEKMLKRLNRPAAPAGDIKPSFIAHLDRLRDWLGQQQNIESFSQLQRPDRAPAEEAERISSFLGGAADAQAMAEAVDPSLYRNRKEPAAGDCNGIIASRPFRTGYSGIISVPSPFRTGCLCFHDFAPR